MMNKLEFIIIIILFACFSCDKDVERGSVTKYAGHCVLKSFMDSCAYYKGQCILYCAKECSVFRQEQNMRFYNIDTLRMCAVQKLIGNTRQDMCIILDSNGICNIASSDYLQKRDKQCFDMSLCSTIKQINDFLSIVGQKSNCGNFKKQLETICQLGYNFYIKHFLFEHLPANDSTKMELACELWNNSTISEKRIYTDELLDIFNYLNKYASNTVEALHFEYTEFDFCKMRKGTSDSTEFVFKNVGKIPVIILGIESSCGCTIGTYPKHPIVPGECSKIKVFFKGNSEGIQRKTLRLKAHGCKPITLNIKAVVC